MTIKKVTLVKFIFLVLITVIPGCNSDDGKTFNETDSELEFEMAQITDFPFEEVDYLAIDITQPKIENGKEVSVGEIIITLPHTQIDLLLTLKSVNIDLNKYNLTPSLGSKALFSETEFISYEVSSKTNFEAVIHYNVKVIIEEAPESEILSMTTFELSDSSNDVNAISNKITDSSIQSIDHFLYVLFPNSVNFAALTPNIAFEGATLEYRVNEGEYIKYLIDKTEVIDFKYPNTVDFKISNSLNTDSITYRIIADLLDPIKFDEFEIVIPDLQKQPEGPSSYNGFSISTWTHQGNYPAKAIGADYIDSTTPIIENTSNIFKASLTKNSPGSIQPGEVANVDVSILSIPLLPGVYTTTAVFNYTFNKNGLEMSSWPEDNNNEGIYNQASIKVKVSIVD